MQQPSREDVRAWLAGQRRAQEVIEAELSRDLPRMSRSERLAQFEDLCELWRDRTRRRQRELDRIKIAEVVELRARLRRVSEAYRHE